MAADITDEGFALLPAGTEPPDPDAALSLEQALVDPGALPTELGAPVPLGRAPAIDFVQRRFIPQTAGGPLMLYGLATLGQWVEKCLRTRRGENAACDPEFGLDALFEDLIDGGPYDAGAAAEFEAIVERALAVHPVIDSITEWSIAYTDGDDAAFASFRVIPVTEGSDPIALDVSIPVGGA